MKDNRTRLLNLYGNLSEYYSKGIEEHIKDILESELTINQIINKYCDKYPNNEAITEDLDILEEEPACITDLFEMYDLLDYMHEAMKEA